MIHIEETTKQIHQLITLTDDGMLLVNGKKNATDADIVKAIRDYAKQGATKPAITDEDIFCLKSGHPNVSDPAGTTMSKKAWQEKYGWSNEIFMQFYQVAVLVRR